MSRLSQSGLKTTAGSTMWPWRWQTLKATFTDQSTDAICLDAHDDTTSWKGSVQMIGNCSTSDSTLIQGQFIDSKAYLKSQTRKVRSMLYLWTTSKKFRRRYQSKRQPWEAMYPLQSRQRFLQDSWNGLTSPLQQPQEFQISFESLLQVPLQISLKWKLSIRNSRPKEQISFLNNNLPRRRLQSRIQQQAQRCQR